MTPLFIVLKNQFGEESINPAQYAPNVAGPIFFGGSGVPTMQAPKNSLYMQTDATSHAAYLYRNTDGASTWVALTV